MAEWRKVIVSGSAAVLSQVNVATNQTITNLQATTVLTGSFTGSFKGDGQFLTGLIAATGTVSGSTQILAGLASSTIHSGSFFNGITVVSGSAQVLNGSGVFSGSAQLPAGIVSGSSQVLAGTTIHSGSFFNGITVVSGSAQISYTGLTGVPAGIVSGSSQVLNGSGVFSGSAQLPTGTVSGSTQTNAHLPTGTVSGSSQVSYTGLSNTPAGIVSGSSLASSPQGNITLTTNGVAQTAVVLHGLTAASTPTFAGISTTGNITTTTVGTLSIFPNNATTVNAFGAATTLNLGATTGTTTVNNNLSVLGTLYVQGPVTAISSSNLYVADQFILLASGSAGNTDGGIVIDRGTFAGLNIAYGFDSTTGRWGYQAGVTDTSNVIDPAGISGSFAGYVFTEAAHTATKPTTGEFVQAGAIYTNDDGTIWMYA